MRAMIAPNEYVTAFPPMFTVAISFSFVITTPTQRLFKTPFPWKGPLRGVALASVNVNPVGNSYHPNARSGQADCCIERHRIPARLPQVELRDVTKIAV